MGWFSSISYMLRTCNRDFGKLLKKLHIISIYFQQLYFSSERRTISTHRHFSIAVLLTLLWNSAHGLSATSLFIWITSGIGAARLDSWFHEYKVNGGAFITTITFVNISIQFWLGKITLHFTTYIEAPLWWNPWHMSVMSTQWSVLWQF